MRLEEIRDMSSEERMGKLYDLRTELLRLSTMIKAGGTVENPTRIKHLRRTIARILTIENEQRTQPQKVKTKEKRKK
jgi:large subunit ribosomal protein L29